MSLAPTNLPRPIMGLSLARCCHLGRGAVLPLAGAGCALGAAAFVAADDPSTGGGISPCPIRALTGIWCPGCGLTRAVHHLVHGDVAHALSLNALTPLVVASIALLWAVWFRVATGAGVPRLIRALPVRAYVSAGAIVLAFTLARNLPGLELLRGG